MHRWQRAAAPPIYSPAPGCQDLLPAGVRYVPEGRVLGFPGALRAVSLYLPLVPPLPFCLQQHARHRAFLLLPWQLLLFLHGRCRLLAGFKLGSPWPVTEHPGGGVLRLEAGYTAPAFLAAGTYSVKYQVHLRLRSFAQSNM